MNKERKKQLTSFALRVAKEEFAEEKTMDIKLELYKVHPTFQELMILDDLIQDFIEKIEKGEIKNEG